MFKNYTNSLSLFWRLFMSSSSYKLVWKNLQNHSKSARPVKSVVTIDFSNILVIFNMWRRKVSIEKTVKHFKDYRSSIYSCNNIFFIHLPLQPQFCTQQSWWSSSVSAVIQMSVLIMIVVCCYFNDDLFTCNVYIYNTYPYIQFIKHHHFICKYTLYIHIAHIAFKTNIHTF